MELLDQFLGSVIIASVSGNCTRTDSCVAASLQQPIGSCDVVGVASTSTCSCLDWSSRCGRGISTAVEESSRVQIYSYIYYLHNNQLEVVQQGDRFTILLQCSTLNLNGSYHTFNTIVKINWKSLNELFLFTTLCFALELWVLLLVDVELDMIAIADSRVDG
jgi:hypothetical protein